MFKEEFAQELRNRLPKDIESKASSERIVNTFLDIVKDSLREGESVTFVNFGTFDRAERAPRAYKSLQTGETETTKKKRVPVFRPGKELKDAVAIKRGRPKKKA